MIALALALAPAPAAQAQETRALYRIPPTKSDLLARFLARGIDVAGTGPDGTLHAILSPGDVAAARSLGIVPEPLDLAPRGAHGAAESPLANPNLGDYHTYDETKAEMASYAASHPSIAVLDTIGVSIEGRPILAMKISDNPTVEEPEPKVLLVGCHHARELMSVEIPLYAMRRLLEGYGVDPVLTGLVDTREIWIVPIANPDGHVYVQNHSGGQSDGWWRKNRRPNTDGSFGVDLNRNYGFNWGYDDFGSSPTPASDVYRGTVPFSEPETAAIRDLMAAHTFNISASFHSYGELFLYPWGYDRLDTPDHAVFHALGDSVALQNGYLAGNPKSNAIYITNGDMDDWVYGDAVTKPRLYGFTFEVNTVAQGGFFPSDALIPSTCALNWGPILTLIRFADAPRRAIAPPRPLTPVIHGDGTAVVLDWDDPADGANTPVRHDVRRMDAAIELVDDAEAGVADWDSTRFEWSTTRATSGAHSYWSGSADNRESILAARASFDVAAGESLVVSAFWDLETYYDYWYAEGSSDGGATWTLLQGDHTTENDPFGNNEGSGVTGTSGGAFLRAAFSLAPFAGKQLLVRFRCETDVAGHGEGLYLDDITPTGRYIGPSISNTGSPATEQLYDPPPSAPAEFQVRVVDAEGQASLWSDRVAYEPGVTAVAVTPAPHDALLANAPNPFNPFTTIRYVVGAGEPGRYRLTLHDVAGRCLATIAGGFDDGRGAARALRWNAVDGSGRALATGVYILRLESARGVTTRKITLLR